MKKILFTLAAGLIPALVATNGAYAQNSVNTEVVEAQKNVTEIEKTLTPANDRIVNLGAVSPKALKDFSKAYKNVTAESWEKTGEGFAAKFTSNGVQSMIYYNNKGAWTGSLKNYHEEKMPTDVRKIVKREYYDYTITFVQEVLTTDSDSIPTYIIHLEDKDSIKLVRVHDGEMDVWKDYKKQS
ncbi:MAG: hypothetical protein ABI707_07985 [Ferruginibacter sp.]